MAYAICWVTILHIVVSIFTGTTCNHIYNNKNYLHVHIHLFLILYLHPSHSNSHNWSVWSLLEQGWSACPRVSSDQISRSWWPISWSWAIYPAYVLPYFLHSGSPIQNFHYEAWELYQNKVDQHARDHAPTKFPAWDWQSPGWTGPTYLYSRAFIFS